jgi:type IV pilus assembly protein PilA
MTDRITKFEPKSSTKLESVERTGTFSEMRKQKGFSLIELLIVVAIILIIAAIAIPNLLRSKMAANEASAVASTRTLVTAEATYQSTYQTYADNITKLGPATGDATSTTAGLIDNVLANAGSTGGSGKGKSGFFFDISGASDTAFTVKAKPTASTTGNRGFCANESGVLHFASTYTAAASCNPASADTNVLQ